MADAAQPSAPAAAHAGQVAIRAWEDDPAGAVLESLPPANQPVARRLPDFNPPGLAVDTDGARPNPGQYQPGTADFRYWAAADALARAAGYWSGRVPAGTNWQADNGPKLVAHLDDGFDFNAFYDRNGLHFFHGSVRGTTVFSGESPDVICHELGHAVLDAIKPQLWDAASIEAAAFHESFADISAILSNLQVPELRDAVLAETGGLVNTASRLSRLAETLGWAIRQLIPDSTDHECLRSAVNSFYYQDPATLPPSAPASALASEPHNFSRLFTAAFFSTLGGMFFLQQDQTADSLLTAADDAGKLLIEAVRHSPVVPAWYSQVAAHMIQADTQLFGSKYRRAIANGYVGNGILSLRSGAAAGGGQAMAGGPAGDNGHADLAEITLGGEELGLPSDVTVRAASHPMRLRVAPGRPDVGDAETPAPDTAATSYVADLLRRGRIAGREELGDAVPVSRRYHTHEVTAKDGTLELRRLRFDCGFVP
jgi:hypothetical protein